MHLIEDVLQLALHLHACVDAQFAQFCRDSVKWLLALSHVNNHHHVEILLHDSLRNVEDVYLIVCQIGADLSNDTHRILAHNCNNCSCHILFVILNVIVIAKVHYLFLNQQRFQKKVPIAKKQRKPRQNL